MEVTACLHGRHWHGGKALVITGTWEVLGKEDIAIDIVSGDHFGDRKMLPRAFQSARPALRSAAHLRRGSTLPRFRPAIVAGGAAPGEAEKPPRGRTPGGRSFATAKEDAKPLTGLARVRHLFKEHGVAFAALYCGGYTLTFVPIAAALTVGGVDGPDLLLQGAEYLEIPYDLTWLVDGRINKDLVNALIAMEINAWLEPVRLPLVIAATPKASKWLADRRRGGADPPPKT